ncbi:hypothetical protein Q9295_11845 [Xinfangfangia sp. CPCC 101601]|uniref:DUF2336 domain-containing protein n=1 Tax=Pseudogemmobacter lacusdianii TaxID=3069608 RepID=A0ABU0VZ89_9RHOB|nr:hypothetical protein [Xinfangfangia sp. CPCC 101601]MDQ2067072.1 hypothetical protein [Xinfangfangia sp. CPCC 101601]
MEHDPNTVAFVLREHVGLAAFLWAQRDSLAQEDPADFAALATVDGRLAANLDALLLAGGAAWPMIDAALADYPEKGEVFLYAHHALQNQDWARLEALVPQAAAAEEGLHGLGAALAHLPPAVTAAVVRDWLGHSDGFRVQAALEALTIRKVDPGQRLAEFLRHPDSGVRTCACHLAAVLERQDLKPELRQLYATDAAAQTAAGRALARMGEPVAAQSLMAEVAEKVENWPQTLRILLSCLPADRFAAWMTELGGDPATREIVVRAVGMAGDRQRLDWILAQMAEPETIIAAGHAVIDLCPEAASQEELWSSEAAKFPPRIAAHFQEDMPRLPLAKAMAQALLGGARKGRWP